LVLCGAQSIGIADSAVARERPALLNANLVARAARGDPSAQTYLGYLYAKGRGVPQDYGQAVLWLSRAAEQGAPAAQFLLGLMYDKGHGAPQDFRAAYFWLNLAAAHAPAGQRAYWTRMRDAVALNLSLNELAETQWRASHWVPLPE